MSIGFIGHSHHRVTGSSRFLLDALRTRGTVEERWSDGWRAAAALDPETLVTRDDEDVAEEKIKGWRASGRRIAEIVDGIRVAGVVPDPGSPPQDLRPYT